MVVNNQTPKSAAQQDIVAQACRPIQWIRPSASDPEILPLDRAYSQQLAQYVQVLGAERGAIVYMSTGVEKAG
jgi:hypothetical protein